MKKEKQERRLYFRAAMLLLVMMLATVTTWADNYETLKSTTKTWENNTYVTNGNVTIANRITVKGNVTLILTDGYILTASKGIEVSEGNSLTIEGGTNGTGKLIIEGCAEGKAGIGGGDGTPVKYGNITINGGIVNVKGGKNAAGIGGNNNSITGCGTITINGGIVNATGGAGAAGIGGVIYGNITINGGIVNVKGGDQSAGIGGNYNSECSGNGTITINGGIVNATGGKKAAGIGGGNGYDSAKGGCGDIVINGGQVTATGGGDGPGIGPGKGDAKKTSGSLVLGWTNTTDFIKVTGVKSNLRVVYGFSDRLKSINFAVDKKFNISGGGEATIKDITNLESVELIPKGSEQYQLSEATISGISASYDLTGSYLDIPFSVSDAEEKTLTLGTDYTATLGTTSQESTTIHITEGGKYTLTINGMGSYAGSKSVDFEVVSIGFKKDANGDDYINMPKTGIYDADIPEGVSSFNVYDDGGAKAKYSNSYDGGLVLTAPDHYVLQLTGTVTAEVQVNNPLDYLMVYDGGSTSAQKIGDKYGSESGEDIGTLISSGTQMTLTFHSDVSGQRDGLDLKVTLKRDIRSCDIANIEDQTYTGSAIEPAVTVTDGETTLTLGTDYEVAYSNNISAGTATITITGKGNYAKTTSKTFTIVKATPTVTAPIAVADLEYKGSEQELVTTGDTDFGTLLYSLDGENYSADIPTGTDAGTYTIYYKVEGSDNWNKVEAQSITVTIDKATPYVKTTPTASAITFGQTLSDSELNDGVIQISENIATEIAGTFAWTNKSVKPSVTDSENTEYEVTFTPTDSENCKSVTIGVTLTVNKATPTVTAPIAKPLTYNGSEQELITTGSTDFGTLLYSLDGETYSENIPTRTGAGTYTVYYKVEGSDNWNAVAAQTIQATIVKDVTCSDISITIPEQTYTGSELTPVITMKDGEAELTKNTDYTVTAPSGTIKDAGNYTYTITGQGNYKGETTATFTIAPKAVTNEDITVTIPSQPWTGSELTPVITVKDGETELTKNTDYTVTAPSGTVQDAGDYTYTITGIGNYTGTKEATFTIVNPVTTSYVDATGTLHENVIAIPLDDTMTTLPAGTYVVNSDVAYTSGITTTGDVTLILADGCTMSFGTENERLNATIIECNNHNLTIYGQSGGTGWLKAYSASGSGIYAVDDYKQYSGNVLIRNYGGACIDAREFTILGGTLDLESGGGGNGDISGGSISILGGKLWARNNGLQSTQGITLGYTNTTDQIYVTIYNAGGTGLEITDGKTLVDENGTIWSGALYNNQIQDINEKTLKPLDYTGVTLTKDGYDVSATFDGTSETTVSIPVDVKVTSVTYNRAFTEGKPSTVMLPFSLGEGQTLTGGTLYKFSDVTKNETTGMWEATMTETAALQANTPYLLMPDNELVDGKVTFNLNWGTVTLNTTGGGNGVTADEGSHWTFKGTYKYMKWTTDTSDPGYNAEREAEIGRAYGFAGVAKTDIEVGDFVRVASGAKIRPMRAYLLWNDIPNSANARSFTRSAAATEELPQSITVKLVGANGEVTGIGTLDTKTGEMTYDSEAWYTLDGVRLSGKPTKKGLYINNGKKVVIE